MSSQSYMPLDKYELRSFTPQFSPTWDDSEDTQTPHHLPFSGDSPNIDLVPNRKRDKSPEFSPLKADMKQPAIPTRSRHRTQSRLESSVDVLRVLVLPLFAVAYLAFCYAVHGRVIPLNTLGLVEIRPEHLATIKSGVTAISILVITLALYPLTSILLELKSEEFFRSLKLYIHGVPLPILNNISSPTFGLTQSLKAIIGRHCSPYFTAVIIAGFLVTAASTLAPAALSIQSVMSDSDVMAFSVGAVPPQSVWNMSSASPLYGSQAGEQYQLDQASGVVWAELTLGMQYSFGVTNATDTNVAYVVPTPVGLSTSTSARWLTDVAILYPSCTWATTNISSPLIFGTNLTNSTAGYHPIGINLVNLDLDVTFTTPYLSSSTYVSILDPSYTVVNHSTLALPTDGSSTWMLGQCMSASGCPIPSTGMNTQLDFTGIPTTTFTYTDSTWDYAFLVCKPNAAIETREVRSDGSGGLTVQPLNNGQRLVPQGNLNPVQATSLLAVALRSFSTKSGPTPMGASSLGTAAQVDFFFGSQQSANFSSQPAYGTNTGNLILNILPLSTLTSKYTRMIQAGAKVYTSGFLGTSYVPGRLSTPAIIFTSSLPLIIVSTILFAVLSAITIWSHFRSGKGHEFNLVNVAAVVRSSDPNLQFDRLKNELAEGTMPGDDGKLGEEIVKMMGKRRVLLEKQSDGSAVLHVD